MFKNRIQGYVSNQKISILLTSVAIFMANMERYVKNVKPKVVRLDIEGTL